MADLCVVQPMLEQQICVLGCADPSHQHTLSRPVVIDQWRDEPWQVTASNAAWHLISGVFLTEKHTLARACENRTLEKRWGLREVGAAWSFAMIFNLCSTICGSYAAFLWNKGEEEGGSINSAGIIFERMWFSEFMMGFIHSEHFSWGNFVRTMSWTAFGSCLSKASHDLAEVNSSVCLRLQK